MVTPNSTSAASLSLTLTSPSIPPLRSTPDIISHISVHFLVLRLGRKTSLNVELRSASMYHFRRARMCRTKKPRAIRMTSETRTERVIAIEMVDDGADGVDESGGGDSRRASERVLEQSVS